jgi:hypothetical protein
MVDTAAALIRLVLRVLVLKIGAWTVSALIRPVLIKLVLRNPVLIGSKELLIMPPFAILIPPFTLIVDAFRVEGMPVKTEPPFMDDTKRPAVLMVLVLRAGVMTPPFRVARPATCIVVVAPIAPLNIAPGGSTTRPPTANVCPNTVKELFNVAGFCIVTFPPLTTRPPFVIVCPPFTVTVERKMVEGMVPPPPPGGYTAPFTELTLMLPVLMLMVLRAGDLIFSDAAKTEAPTIAPN